MTVECPKCKKIVTSIFTRGIEEFEKPEKLRCQECHENDDPKYKKQMENFRERHKDDELINAIHSSIKEKN